MTPFEKLPGKFFDCLDKAVSNGIACLATPGQFPFLTFSRGAMMLDTIDWYPEDMAECKNLSNQDASKTLKDNQYMSCYIPRHMFQPIAILEVRHEIHKTSRKTFRSDGVW